VHFGVDPGRCNLNRWLEPRAADGPGFESVWLPEHLIFPEAIADHRTGTSPSTPIPLFDVFAMLGAIGAVTDRTARHQRLQHRPAAPVRHRGAATVDIVSNGRFILGVGASWLAPSGRPSASICDAHAQESIAICRRLWTEPVVAHTGGNYNSAPWCSSPSPRKRTCRSTGETRSRAAAYRGARRRLDHDAAGRSTIRRRGRPPPPHV
jgi:alkanesulfonate monooxygenase SsuD/methylene tetrahydromethanopterin reductase-like flavin-dependent oxidoreductase (luciferase family)